MRDSIRTPSAPSIDHILRLTVALTTASFATAHAQVVIQDGQFAPSDWNQLKIADSSPAATTGITAVQQLSGGHPGAFRSVQLDFVDTGNVLSANFFSRSVYTPSSQGPINQLNWSADLRGDPAIENAQFGFSLLVRQDGAIYQWWQHSASGAAWQNVSDSGLTAADFFAAGDPASNLHPDFSASGTTVEFGFLLSKQDSGPLTIITGIDNWTVTVNPVPEPSTYAAIFGASLAGFAGLRRWRLRRQQL